MKKPDINAVLAVSVRRQLDDANSVIASLTQERHELRSDAEIARLAREYVAAQGNWQAIPEATNEAIDLLFNTHNALIAAVERSTSPAEASTK